MTRTPSSPLKAAVAAYVATPADDTKRRGELFEAIEGWIYAEFEAEPISDEELDQIDVAALAQAYIDRATY